MDVMKDNAQKRILCDTVKFLEDYEWIFNFKVTHILQDEIVDNIPVEWFEYLSDLDIDNFDSVFLDLNADTGQEPIFVKEFLGTYRSVQKYFDQKSVIKKVSWKHHSNRKENRKISLKKQHEISNFSKYIANKVPTNLKIVDIGSGLGYIGEENIVKWKNQTKEDHLKHMKNVCYRAVLEKVSNDNCLKLVKKKRKGILQSDTEDVEKYLESLSERFLLPDSLIEKFKSDFKICYDENLKHFHLFEVLTGLQFMLQSVIENLIIFDRLLYLQEFCSLSECEIAEIFDPSISPRNKVIFARKNR